MDAFHITTTLPENRVFVFDEKDCPGKKDG